jgi:hypothetical protein
MLYVIRFALCCKERQLVVVKLRSLHALQATITVSAEAAAAATAAALLLELWIAAHDVNNN